MYKIYKVEENETLTSIANKLKITPDMLAQLNGININTFLTPGSYIIIPAEDTPFNQYTVKKGDTIYLIAQKYNVKPNQLLRLNGLNQSDYIYPEQSIYVPKEGVEFYITAQDDTLKKIATNLNTSPTEIVKQNDTIYLVPDQLIVYKNPV